MDIARGALTGAIMGAAVSWLHSYLKESENSETVSSSTYIKINRDMSRIINKLSVYSHVNETLFNEIVELAEELCRIKYSPRSSINSDFKCNRQCITLNKKIKQFVVSSPMTSLEQTVNLRSIISDEQSTSQNSVMICFIT